MHLTLHYVSGCCSYIYFVLHWDWILWYLTFWIASRWPNILEVGTRLNLILLKRRFWLVFSKFSLKYTIFWFHTEEPIQNRKICAVHMLNWNSYFGYFVRFCISHMQYLHHNITRQANYKNKTFIEIFWRCLNFLLILFYKFSVRNFTIHWKIVVCV